LPSCSGVEFSVDSSQSGFPISVTVSQAAADCRGEVRREVRRTARRTARRQAHLRSLPRGCPLVGPYYYCGGVYYQSVVQNGATVYIIVNP